MSHGPPPGPYFKQEARIIFFSNNGAFSEEGNQYFGTLKNGGLVFEGRPASATSSTTKAA
jgi:hypothetical protein